MNTRIYTDEELGKLRSMAKQVTNPRARWVQNPKANPVHRQRGFHVVSLDDDKLYFAVYLRQSLLEECNFSCGIQYLGVGGIPLVLARYNGPSHRHGDLGYCSHIHIASQRAISAGRKSDSEATETDRFVTLEGALYCLVQDFNIRGIHAQQDQPVLFQ